MVRDPGKNPAASRQPRRRNSAGGLPRLSALVAVLGATLGAGGSLAAQEWKEFRALRQEGGFDRLDVEIVYGAGRLQLAPADRDVVYDIRMRYDADRFVPLRSWSQEGGRGRLRIAFQGAEDGSRSRPKVRLDEFDLEFNVDDLRKLGDSSGRMEVRLGRQHPTDLKIHVGAAESRIELGGIPLTRLEMNTGASETRLAFSSPNPAPMSSLSLKAGAASFRAEGLGNAGFETFSFEGGVGSVTLDFGGEWRRSASASIKMGVGSLSLVFPPDLGVRIRKKSFLTSFDASGFVKVGDAFQTPNWDEATVKLDLSLDTAFGSVRVEREP